MVCLPFCHQSACASLAARTTSPWRVLDVASADRARLRGPSRRGGDEFLRRARSANAVTRAGSAEQNVHCVQASSPKPSSDDEAKQHGDGDEEVISTSVACLRLDVLRE